MIPADWRFILPAVTVCALGPGVLAQTKQPAVKPGALLKLAEPWPDAATLEARRVDAEGRRLFASNDALPVTITADFKGINKDRSATGKKAFPATVAVANEDGQTTTLQATLRTRGHFRLRATTCSFVPIRVMFERGDVKGTIFDHQKALKLVTHCQSDKEYEQLVLREYLVYRTMNLLTPRSFRARRVKVTYLQAPDAKPIITRIGMFLEDDDDVARRLEGRVMDLPRALFKDVDQESLSLAMVFEYMIGNTDFSLYALHNFRLIRTQANKVYTVPYDFDLSGLVNASYAVPDRVFGLKSVRDRLYRGPCRSGEDLQPVLDQFKAHKTEMLALYDSIPELDASSRQESKSYLEEFFRTIERPGDVKRTFIDGQCSKKSTM